MGQHKMEIVSSGGCLACGGRCPYKVWVEEGIAKRIEPYGDLRPCVRGYANRNRVYSSERLKAPLRRVGQRGEGKFEEISWDEALDTVAAELLRVKKTYGNSAILVCVNTAVGQLHSGLALGRLMNMFGGFTAVWGSISAEAAMAASRITYGTLTAGHTRNDILFSKMVLMWGFNPAETIFGTDTIYHLIQAREKGTKFIAIDPRFTNSAAQLAGQWVPIRPGTDTSLLLAMAYVMIKGRLQDQRFLDTYTTGFEVFANYVLGKEDGIPKTPQWAEAITGVSHDITEKLALDYATIKPAALITGWAPGRTAFGEQFHRAASTLAAMTGNIGIHGGDPAGYARTPSWTVSSPTPNLGPTLDVGKNPLEPEGLGPLMGSPTLDPSIKNRHWVHFSRVWDAILKGKSGGYPGDFKFFYNMMANPINQYPNTNKAIEAVKKLEFIVVHEQFMTPTARFADIVLPATTHWERNDFLRPWIVGSYFIFANKVIAPLHQCKSDFDICRELAKKLGIEHYSDKSEEEWLKTIIASSPDTAKELPDYSQFKKEGIHRLKLAGPLVPFKEQIEDPEHNPFPTPSGKIEIFSQRLAELKNPVLPAIPKYIPTWEGKDDPLARQYPLQLINFHVQTKTHSSISNIPLIKDLQPHTIWISPRDAQDRDINDGESVKVFNQRGEMNITAYVTHRIMPGVVAVAEGAWYRPDEHGVDNGGCTNILTKDEPSPIGSFVSNTSLVQIEKI